MGAPVPNDLIVGYPHPSIILDTVLVERTSNKLGTYTPIEPGAPFKKGTHTAEQLTRLEGNEFLMQKASADEEWIERYYGKAPSTQDIANWDAGFSGDANAYPIFQRRYLEKRDSYTPRTKAAPLPGLYRINVTGAVTVFTTAPAISFAGGTGSGATAIAVLDNNGLLSKIVIKTEGNYTVVPTVVIAGGAAGDTAVASLQPLTCILVKEDTADNAPEPYKSLYIVVTRLYETLPGPWLFDSRDDLLLGPVQRQRRAILASTIPAALPVPTATVKTTYEARDRSAIVAWEIVETNSDGTGTAGNPAFPIHTDDPYDKIRGPINQASQVVIATGAEAASRTLSGNTVTQITYEAIDQFKLRKVTETYTLPGPSIDSTRIDDMSGAVTLITRQLLKIASLNSDLTYSAGSFFQERFYEGYDALSAIQITEATNASARVDAATAVVETYTAPYQFPGYIIDYGDSGGITWTAIDFFGDGIGVRQAQSENAVHTKKTWWEVAAAKPTVSVDSIEPGDIVINSKTYKGLLFDTMTRVFGIWGTFSIPGTTPDFTTYYGATGAMGAGPTPPASPFAAGTGTKWIGTSKIIKANVEQDGHPNNFKITTISIVMR